MAPDPKSGKRIVDPDALRRARALFDECAGCGGPPANVHHIVQKGSPHFGDDVIENLLLLCGTGTSGCHGAWHGSPYVAYVQPVEGLARQERRDKDWVAERVGRYILRDRPDTLQYVLKKLGSGALVYLEREYRVITADFARALAGILGDDGEVLDVAISEDGGETWRPA